ncbi:MAG TPA: hypothetical protein VHI51_17125 [Ktedonobacterales bacterium]|jgi:hypothetical protein|nr:hypothetical protein [Ktedonobacterales bacterium]
MNVATRLIATFNGIVTIVATIVIDILYSLAHSLERIVGVNPDSSHFFIGLACALVEVLGLIASFFNWYVGAALMLVGAVGFFFLVGWWAFIPLIFAINTIAMLMTGAREINLEERLHERGRRHGELPSAT